MPHSAQFVDGPLDGQTYLLPHAPSTLFAQRTVGATGVDFAPTSREADPSLHAGVYRKTADPWSAGPLYRFEEKT
jgi:hypothetical protein